jgi:murein DD-endopeptidase MepM/ murein hydrolase activator NlpD
MRARVSHAGVYGAAAAVLVAAALAACGDAPGDAGTGPVGVATVHITPDSLSLETGATGLLSVVVRDAAGSILTGRTSTWTSADTAVASVGPTGQVTARSAGATSVRVEVEGRSAAAGVRVIEPLRFGFPMEGELNRDFFYTNYVDHDPSGGIRDHTCGLKTYDGHRGVDIVLPTFRRMDEGVRVLAGAAGRVFTTADGHPDRNKSWNPAAPVNQVTLQHRDGYQSVYLHLKRGSVRVSPGDSVPEGAILGEAGSSGMSDMPHLHIEFRRNGQLVDAYAGSCGSAATLWRNPLPYQDAFRLIDAQLTTETVDMDRVKDPPSLATTVAPGTRITFWVHLHNVRPSTVGQWRAFAPDGTPAWSSTRNHDTFYSMSWWWAWYTVQAPGTWRFEYVHAGTVLAERTVTVSGAMAALRDVSGPPEGSGGGFTMTHGMPGH